MSFVPSPDILAAFTLAALVLILTPGPDMTLFIGETLRAGRARGFAAMFGAISGILIHSTLAAIGLSALLATSATAYTGAQDRRRRLPAVARAAGDSPRLGADHSGRFPDPGARWRKAT